MSSVSGRRGWLLVLVMLVALVGAGCGSDEPTDAGAQSGSGAEVSGLITDGTLTVGTELPAPPFKTGEQYGAVVNKGSPNLNAFNQVIKTLKSEGYIDQLLQKYFSDQVSVPVIG